MSCHSTPQNVAVPGHHRWHGPGHDAGGRREPVRRPCSAGAARMADRQWQRLHRQGDARLRHRAQSHCLLHASPKPGVEWHVGELRQNLQTRLCSHQCLARMRSQPSARSPGGSRTTTTTILTQGSKCAPRGSSSGHKLNSRLSGQIGATPRTLSSFNRSGKPPYERLKRFPCSRGRQVGGFFVLGWNIGLYWLFDWWRPSSTGGR